MFSTKNQKPLIVDTVIGPDTQSTAPVEPSSLMEWFAYVQFITDKLTLRRIMTVLLFGILTSIVLVAFENRDKLFDMAVNKWYQSEEAAPWVLSGESKATLTTFIKNNALVGVVLVSEVDLKRNKKTPRFWFADDEEVMAGLDAKVPTTLPQAMFDYDPKNTQQMVAVLNNEFVCSRYQDTGYARLMPGLGSNFPVVCRIAIPPFYGRFVGMMTFGLTTNPSKEEVDALRIEASRIAVELYLRDVVHKTK